MNREILETVIMRNMMTCRQVENFLMDYLDGRLSFWTRIRFNFHIMLCPNCPKYMQEYKNVIALGKQIFENPDDQAVGNVPNEILHAILDARNPSK